MTRRLKITLLTFLALLGLCLVTLVAGGFLLVQNQDWLRDRLIAGLEENLGQSFELAKAELGFSPWPFLKLEGASSQGPHLTIAFKRAVIAPDVSDLFLGQVNPDHIELEDPLLEIDDLETFILEHKDSSSEPKSDSNLDLPSGCQLFIKNGTFKVKSYVKGLWQVAGLDCYLSTGFFGGLSGDLTVKNAKVNYAGQEFTLSNLLLLGEVSLSDFRRAKLDCNFVLQNKAWLKNLNFSTSLGSHSGHFEIRTKLDGVLLKDGVDLDFDWSSEVRLLDLKELLIKRAYFSLGDRDFGTFNGNFDLAKRSLSGHLHMPRVSLTEWLTFARSLPPGLQISLDNVQNVNIDFTIDGQKLVVPKVSADCQGSHFSGVGGVSSWSKPVVFLDMNAPKVNLIAGIAEAGGESPDGPIFMHGPLTPEIEPTPGPSSVGYDIRLGADNVKYGPLTINKAKVIIHPAPLNAKNEEDILLDATAQFYEGKFNGQLRLGGLKETTFNIKVALQDVNALGVGRAMPIIPVRKGKWAAQAQVTSLGTKLGVFLKNLRGTVKVDGTRGEFAIPKSTKNIPFVNLNARLDPLKFGQWQGKMLGLEGAWKLNLDLGGTRVNSDLTGKIWFGRKQNQTGVEFQNIPLQLSYRVDTPGSLPKNFSCQSKAKLTYLMANNIVKLQDFSLSLPGLEYSANGELGQQKDGFALKTQGSISINDFAKALTSVRGSTATVPDVFKQIRGNLNCRVTPTQVTLDNLHLRTGLGLWHGQINYPLAKGGQPDLEFTLDKLDLDAYLAKNPSNPNKKIDVEDFKSLTAKGTLHIRELVFKKLRFFRLRLPFDLKNGRLTVNHIGGQLYGGNLYGSAKLTLASPISLETGGKIAGADLGMIARDKMEKSTMSGRADVAGLFKASFSRTSDWPNCLSGSWNMRVFDGKYQGFDDRGRPKGSPTTFNLLQASGKLANSLLTSRDVFIHGSDFKLKGVGEFNISTQAIDCKFDVDKRGMPHFPIYIEGKIGKVKTAIGAGQFILNAIGGIFSGFK